MAEKEYIEREAARKIHCYFCSAEQLCDRQGNCNAMNAFDAIPIADVRKVVQGKPVPHYEIWLNSDGEPVQTVRLGLQCPFCGDTGIKKYCPNCGAEIIDEKEGERNVDTAHLDRR